MRLGGMNVLGRSSVIVLGLGLAVLLAGCPKKPQVGRAESGAVGSAAQPAPGAQAQALGRAPQEEAVKAQPGTPGLPGVRPGAQAAPRAAAPGTGVGTLPASPGVRPGAELAPRPEAPGVTPGVGPGAPLGGVPPAPGVGGLPVSRPRAEPESPLKGIFFETDRATLRPEARALLDGNVKWLRANPKASIVIEGHCDERGTVEYNLALGERRAYAAREYLVAAGIDPNRISTVSYGKERPFVLGHDEEAWKWNRRAHFVVK